MLCLLFTRKKLFCGYAEQPYSLLSIAGKEYLELGTTPPEELLRENLQAITESYYRHLASASLPQPSRVQTAIAFPKNFPDPLNKDPHILNQIEEIAGNAWDVLAGVDNSQAYIWGIKETLERTPSRAPSIVLDALDGKVSLYYQGLNGKAGENGKSKVVFLENLSLEKGRENVLEQLVKAFQQMGLNLNEKDVEDLRQQVRNPMRNGTYTLVKSNDMISITAKAQLPENKFTDLLTQDRASLKPYLEVKALEELGINEVILMGEYLKNPGIQEYLAKELQLDGKLVGIENAHDEADLLAIMKGLGKIGHKELEHRIEEEKRKRLEEEQQRQREIELQVKRDALVVEIREKCQDESLKEQYESTYIERGEQVGLPKEVVAWNIQEALRIARLVPDRPRDPELFPQNTSLIHTNILETVQTPIPDTTEAEPLAQTLPRLKDLFDIKGVLPDNEFNTKKVWEKQSKSMKVVRLLSSQKQNDPEWSEKFNHLYQKELAYYGELSDIRNAQEGKFYTRPYFERTTLKEYVRKAELFNKKGIEQLGSNELKLILQVMKEINDSEIGHAEIHENNILVITRRKWGLQKELFIKLVGFTSAEATKEQMEIQFHEMWERLLGKGFYQDFRNKFSL